MITATDGTASASLPAFSIDVTGPPPVSATLSWSAPIDNTNGTPLTDLAGFYIFYGTSATALNSVQHVDANVNMYSFTGLTAGKTYYFSVAAISTIGLIGPASVVVSKKL